MLADLKKRLEAVSVLWQRDLFMFAAGFLLGAVVAILGWS